LAIKNHTAALSLFLPPRWDGEENQKEKTKLIGCDKNSFTEWQREKKITTILIKRIYSMQCSHHARLTLLLSSKPPPSTTPLLNTEPDVTQYRISHLIGWFGSAQPVSCEN